MSLGRQTPQTVFQAMSRAFDAAVLATAALMAPLASAIPISDNYIGAMARTYGDVIGNVSDFGIDSADVSQTGSELFVTIETAFAGRAGEGLFSGYTRNGKGIGYGDLFLASSWSPYDAAPHGADNAYNGTRWQYAFKFNDNWSGDSGGNGTLYALHGTSNADNAVLAEELFTSGVHVRDGQEVLVDMTATPTQVGTGSWSVIRKRDAASNTQGLLQFTIDISATTLDYYDDGSGNGGIAFHWGPTCANDVIEGFAVSSTPPDNRIPEPATLALFGLGLVGAGVARRRSR